MGGVLWDGGRKAETRAELTLLEASHGLSESVFLSLILKGVSPNVHVCLGGGGRDVRVILDPCLNHYSYTINRMVYVISKSVWNCESERAGGRIRLIDNLYFSCSLFPGQCTHILFFVWVRGHLLLRHIGLHDRHCILFLCSMTFSYLLQCDVLQTVIV